MDDISVAYQVLNKKTQVKLHLQKNDNGVYIEKVDKHVQATKIQHAHPGEFEIKPYTRHLYASKNLKKAEISENKVIKKGVDAEIQTEDKNIVEVNKIIQCDFEDFLIKMDNTSRPSKKNEIIIYKKLGEKEKRKYNLPQIERIGKKNYYCKYSSTKLL